MELVTEISRIFLPIVTVIILTKCILTLWLGHPKEKTYGYIVDLFDGERYELNMWETSIGRSNSCDIVISYDTMSRFAAVIARRNDSWYIHDLRSKSGIKVNGKKIEKKSAIEGGDMLTIGSMRFQFEVADDPVVKEKRRHRKKGEEKKAPQKRVQPSQSVKTKQAQYKPNSVAAPTKNSYTVEAPARAKTRTAKKPTIFNRDTHESFVLKGNEMTIGSSPKSGIRLKSSEVAPRHAVLILYEDGWAINDCSGGKGTRLNGKKVTSPQLLFNGDVIALGGERLFFEC